MNCIPIFCFSSGWQDSTGGSGVCIVDLRFSHKRSQRSQRKKRVRGFFGLDAGLFWSTEIYRRSGRENSFFRPFVHPVESPVCIPHPPPMPVGEVINPLVQSGDKSHTLPEYCYSAPEPALRFGCRKGSNFGEFGRSLRDC